MTGCRRRVLFGFGALLLARPPAWARVTGDRFVAAWDDAHGRHHVGVLAVAAAAVRVLQSIEVPSRAHGLQVEPGGSVLALARRPGDWLLRWWPSGARPPQWRWSEPDRRGTGHAVASADGRRLYAGEADQDSGAGLIALRDARTLEKLDEWPSHGIDVHQMLLDARGDLVVANGGVSTRPESGRIKDPEAGLDSSLVRLAGRDGTLLGQWRLADRSLSMRHLAWRGGVLGIALQSEHSDAVQRAAAPLLATFDGETLAAHASHEPLAGYGGDIVATPHGWAVSATRRGGVARYDAAGAFVGLLPLPEACPLAVRNGRLCAGGRDIVVAPDDAALPPLRLDNHWRPWSPG